MRGWRRGSSACFPDKGKQGLEAFLDGLDFARELLVQLRKVEQFPA
jgi:hypothetical protein